MSTDASELPPDEARGLWLALTASQLGAAHQAVGLPNQEQAAHASGDDGLIAYGSTLLLAIAGRRWWAGSAWSRQRAR